MKKQKYTNTANAFFKAIDDDRIKIYEVKYHHYMGNIYGKDIFINKVTGEYLD